MSTSSSLHESFLSLMPRVQLHARIVFRHEKCAGHKDDRIAETLAIAWKWYRRMKPRGKDPATFPTAFASLATRSVRSGRRLAGMLKAGDVMNETTQHKRGFVVGKLPDISTLLGNPLEDALRDNSQSNVPDQVAFRLDFPAWLETRSRRDQCIIRDMSMNERTLDLSRKYRISPARVSQLRRHFKEDCDRFCQG